MQMSLTNHCWCQSSRVIVLSCGIRISTVHHFVTKHACDRRTDIITTPKTARAYARAVIKRQTLHSSRSCYRHCWCTLVLCWLLNELAFLLPLTSNRHHLSYDDCLENKGRLQDCSCSIGSCHCIQCYAHIL